MNYGRQPIYTDKTEINSGNIKQVLEDAMVVHRKNVTAIEKLRKYERGEQDILMREKLVRPEINNKIVENHASEITSFKVGYVFGSPITYVQRAKTNNNEPAKDDERINKLNEMMFEEGKASKDQELAKDFTVCGVGYRIAFPKRYKDGKSPFDILTLNPATTFVVYSMDMYHRPMMGVSFYTDSNNVTHYGVYTENRYFELEGSSQSVDKIISEEINGIGMIPIVEYKNNYDRMGCFENVMPLLDALNLCTSDRLNGLAQFVQSFIWFNNCDIGSEDFKQLNEMGAIKTKSQDGCQANVTVLQTELNQTEVQTLADYLYDQILQIAGVPGRENNAGGDTGNAVMLRNGWQIAETSARSTEMVFTESERQILKVVLKILERSNEEGFEGLAVSDIEVKFSRNRTDGLLTKTQAMVNMFQCGIDPLKVLEVIGIFSDPQQVYADSKERIEEMNKKQEEAPQEAMKKGASETQ